ncbi:hypothetical protein LEP1GSC132_3548 [Leptospira kirschneri str. 200803703]|uniref:Uncharacterized protein n=1 Tax=Leptospira kirschneri str. 200802841 TaxID=1193047 RepID=A0A828Y6F3_9LEPT|nr:hypothetical protein LEP1GSC131_3452 [Leptospira kirschneri str. 200802841]EMK05611.1 hypothetical protein LEP1GSC176_2191 [Leptospira kirschneri str. MMD1493]EMO66785.1 hypothetical protein LEP1GSC132_3548 [Leptospira kirschneri str. 200803703]
MDVALKTGVFKLGTTTGGAYNGLKTEKRRLKTKVLKL